MNAFLTGSRVYGIPSDDSDVDLVVLLSTDDKAKLREVHGPGPIKFGNLNLILCDKQEQFDCWEKSRYDCLKQSDITGAPLTREMAVRIHVENRVNAFGFSKDEQETADE